VTPRDRLIFALDVESTSRALSLVDTLHEHVGIFKIGLELFMRAALAGDDLVRRVARDHRVFLDLKLHDIPETMLRTLRAARTEGGVEFLTIHTGDGPGPLEACSEEAEGIKLLGVTVLTSVGPEDLEDLGYAVDMVDLVSRRARWAIRGGCAGVVCSGREAARVRAVLGEGPLIVTPGIRPAWDGVTVHDQKRVVTPADAVCAGADHIVVGRPIRDAKDPAEAARRIVEEMAGVLD